MLDYKAIGRRISLYRKKIHMTQSKLSEKLDISESYVSQIECGATKVALSRLDEIAEILGVDIVCLLSDKVTNTDVTANSDVFEIIKDWDRKKIDFLINLLLCADKHFKDTEKNKAIHTP